EVKKKYDDDGNLVAEAHFLNGKQHGKATLYYPDGSKLDESEYRDGELNGEGRGWNREGILLRKSNHKDGKLHGDYTSWFNSGVKKEEGRFKNDKRVGKYTWYKPSGEIWSEHDCGEDGVGVAGDLRVVDEGENKWMHRWGETLMECLEIYKDDTSLDDVLSRIDDFINSCPLTEIITEAENVRNDFISGKIPKFEEHKF
ncbi:MAG: hypothetical protein V3T30_09380, partial [Thermodesulfobacteriota bacterium]